jgi:hypothetical protein
MKDSKPIYAICDHEKFVAILWETELGKILVCNGGIENINRNLDIRDIETEKSIKSVDLRNVLMSILPIK